MHDSFSRKPELASLYEEGVELAVPKGIMVIYFVKSSRDLSQLARGVVSKAKQMQTV